MDDPAFFNHTEEVEGTRCLLWKGRTTNKNPTGRVMRDGVHFTVRRWAYILKHSKEPVGHVKPMCGNRHCVNPDHQQSSSESRAILERDKPPDRRRGEDSVHAKLTQQQVKEIKAKFASMTNSTIAREYGVSVTTIWNIRNGFTWTDVGFPIDKAKGV